MANEILSNISVQRRLATSPETYESLENPAGSPTVGETIPLSDVTNLEDTSRRYIAGLADGDEFSVECFSVHTSPSVQQAWVALKGTTQHMRIINRNTRVSPNTLRYYNFDAVFLGWSLQSAVGEPDRLVFSFKISGGVAVSKA